MKVFSAYEGQLSRRGAIRRLRRQRLVFRALHVLHLSDSKAGVEFSSHASHQLSVFMSTKKSKRMKV